MLLLVYIKSVQRNDKTRGDENKLTVEQLRYKLSNIDKMLDDETLSDDQFNALENEARDLVKQIAQAEKQNKIDSIKRIDVNAWEEKFLKSFPCGTVKISNKQAHIFKRISQDQFIFANRIYACMGENYKTGFSAVVITKI